MFSLRSGFQSLSHSLSFSDWLTPGSTPAADPSHVLEDARDAMLDVLGEDGRKNNAKLALRITAAPDALALWCQRPDLMTAASKLFGEAEAQRRMQAATVHFESLLPAAATPRRRRSPALGAAR
jgi:hypothetical protein